MLPQQFTVNTQPIAIPEAMICVGNVRFTILTERIVRMEYHPHAQFEDRATQTFWYRHQPKPNFTATISENEVKIETDHFRLQYVNTGTFTKDNLSITIKATGAVWHVGDADESNLKGTTRTLDFHNGYAPLTDGLISRAGWSLVDDSSAFVLNEQSWLQARDGLGVDWYFCAYGHDYKAILRDYCRISGEMPLIPRWILGNWWSRYWAYTQEELMTLINHFEAQGIPLSVCIIDMDWHVTKTDNDSTGWTGYTWNLDLFPDPQGIIHFLHQKGLRTSLNLHPAEGVHSHEAQYPEMARRMGIDPQTKKPIPFDITDKTFVQSYFEVLHHPYESMGIDFWWVDWQQGQTCNIKNLDPLWLINHLHFLDIGRDSSRRPFIFSRWGNEGHQRYPIGFSGDSYMTWETLRFQPYLTATASNVAYGWWSHDIGGHTSGTGDDELFTRWVQYGVFSPIMRIHSTKGYFYDQRPWGFENADVRDALRDVMQLRHALIPYIYTMARRANTESLPLMTPMYYDYPQADEAYHCPQQYAFGSELIVAPFVDPIDPHTQLARQVVWLPKGDWYRFDTGEYINGNRWQAVYGTLHDIPIFAKAGAIVPMGAKVGWGGVDNPSELHIHIFAGDDNTFTLYEDDGISRHYQNGVYATTTLNQTWSENKLTFTMYPAEGELSVIPEERTIHLAVRGIFAGDVALKIDNIALQSVTEYDPHTETLRITIKHVKPTSKLVMTVSAGAVLLSRRNRQKETLLRMLRLFRLHTGTRNRLADMLNDIIANPDKIAPYLLAMTESQSRALCEILYDAGIHHVADTHYPTLLVLWNNRDDEAITYRYSDLYLFFGGVTANHRASIAPRYAIFTPKIQTWTHGANDVHHQRTQWSLQLDYHNLATVREAYTESSP